MVQVRFTFAVQFRLLRIVCRFKPLNGFHGARPGVPSHILEDPFALPRGSPLFHYISVAESKGCFSLRIVCGPKLKWLCDHLSQTRTEQQASVMAATRYQSRTDDLRISLSSFARVAFFETGFDFMSLVFGFEPRRVQPIPQHKSTELFC